MATVTIRQGVWLDHYKFDDPGGVNDNKIVVIAHQISEVFVQTSSVNYHTFKEDLGCWNDAEVLECPDDDLDPPNGVWRHPVLKQLNDIMLAGGAIVGANLTDLQEKAYYLAFWFEYRTHKVFEDGLAQMVLDGQNTLQQVRHLKYLINGNGVDITTASAIASNWVDNSIQPTYNDLGLATIPLQDRRLLKIFGEVGWFE